MAKKELLGAQIVEGGGSGQEPDEDTPILCQLQVIINECKGLYMSDLSSLNLGVNIYSYSKQYFCMGLINIT